MRKINSESKRLNAALGRGLRTLKPWNWLVILVAVPLLLTAVLWVTAPQLGQAQGAVPAKPTGLTATAGGQQAALAWDDPSDGSIIEYDYLQAQVGKLTAFDGAANDYFGHSVAVDGDTMVAGAYGHDDKGVDSGSAYLFTRQSGVWSRVAKLTASDGAVGDRFGWSVAVDGDTVVVSATWDDDNGPNSGSAYVFTKPASGGWVTATETAKLTAFDGAATDSFGRSVAVDGDTVVVGAYGDDDKGLSSGSAYVFTKPVGGWTSTSTAAKLTASDGNGGDRFGQSVAVDGDTVVVGAYGDDGAQGSAYVFTKPASGGWATGTETAKLTAYDGASNDWFGFSVAVNRGTVVVGARYDDDNGGESGSAYLFTKPASGVWATTNETAKLTASDGATGDQFGRSVAVEGDTVVVGAHRDDNSGSESGSAYVFAKPGAGGWVTGTETATLTASDGTTNDLFGYPVAIDEDTVVVGADGDDDNGSESGSAYVYAVSDWTDIPNSGSGETNATSYTVTVLTNGAEYNFWIRAANSVGTGPASGAVTVTLANTAPTAVDDNSITDENTPVDIIVTANDTDSDGHTLSVTSVTTPSNGTAAIKPGSTTTVTYTPNTDFNGTDSFDYTVSDGYGGEDTGTVAVTSGPPANLAATPDVGQVTLSWDDPGNVGITKYQLMRQAVIEIASTDGSGGDRFGYSVAIDGDTAVTGAYQEDENGNDSGSAYVFTRDSGSDVWSQRAKLTASDGANGDNFGYSVAIDGDTVMVGAHHHNGGNGNNSGAVYVFTKPANGWADAEGTVKLTSSDAGVRDLFGSSIALKGNTAVIGAYEDSHNGVTRAGSAYVFTKDSSGVWGQTAKLTASDGEYEDWFGYSVALDGDTVLVGAKLDAHGAQLLSGSAYVFTKPAGGWADANETVKLTIANTNDRFGHSVAVDGDTAMVAAYLDDTEGPNTGSVYVFTRNASGVWSQQAELTASDAENHDWFGSSVSLDGDTAAIGAYGDDDQGSDAGSVYLFTRGSSGWSETAKFTASDGADDHQLGGSVALDGDFVVAGAYGGTSMASNSGSAYILGIGADWTDISGSGAATTSTQVTGLADGAEYTFGIRAANPAGTGPASSVAASPLWPAPVNLTAEEDSGRVGLQWDTGDYRITNYLVQIEATGGAGDPPEILVSPGSGTTTTAEVTSLTNGVEYTFTVQPARVSGGETVVTGAAATVTATPLLPAPTNLVAAPDKGRVVLQWDTGDSAITNYLVRSQAVGSGDPAEKVVAPGSGTRTTTDITSLTNGTEYVFTVRSAEVSGGETVVTGMGTTVTETPTVAAPAAPTGLAATPGDGEVAVSWDNPGNITIRKYQYNTDGGTTFNHMNGSDRDTTSFTFSNLTNGTQYTLAIRASNLSGASTAATVTVTPLLPAPTNLVAARDSTRVVLQWDTGDPSITNYLIRTEATGGGGDPAEKVVAAGSGTRTMADVTGLTNGTEYTFSVMVAEVSGTDTVATGMAASATKTPGVALPAAPANFTSTVGHGQVAVSWDNPGNITISKYQYSTNGGSTFTDIPNSNEDTTSFTFSNLTNGTEYTLAIRASNLSGGSPGATVTDTPGWPAPTNLVAGVDSGRVVLQWDTGDPAITNYLVRTVDFWNGSAWGTLVSAGSGTRTTAEVTSLTNGTEYIFTVQAAEVSGGQTVPAGAKSGLFATPTVSVPAAPANLTATAGDGQVAVTWDDPGNITIRKYQYSTDGGTTFHHMNGSDRDTTSFTFSNLTNGTEYTLAIRASNLSGESTAATVTATPSS